MNHGLYVNQKTLIDNIFMILLATLVEQNFLIHLLRPQESD
jgi:hypothetical protein